MGLALPLSGSGGNSVGVSRGARGRRGLGSCGPVVHAKSPCQWLLSSKEGRLLQALKHKGIWFPLAFSGLSLYPSERICGSL